MPLIRFSAAKQRGVKLEQPHNIPEDPYVLAKLMARMGLTGEAIRRTANLDLTPPHWQPRQIRNRYFLQALGDDTATVLLQPTSIDTVSRVRGYTPEQTAYPLSAGGQSFFLIIGQHELDADASSLVPHIEEAIVIL